MNNYHEMHPNSRVWVYQSNRNFNPYELISIETKLRQFVEQWTAHSAQVKGYGEIRYNRFVILIADETQTQVSGCSIDSSVHFIRGLMQELDVDFFDRMDIAWKDGEEVKSANKDAFQELIGKGEITDDTTVFNNLVASKAELETKWEVPLKESWHANFFTLV